MRLFVGVVIVVWAILVGGAVAAAQTAGSGAVANVAPPHLTMPTYAGPDGVRVPLGACAAVQGGKVWIVACNSPQALAYKVHLASVAHQAAQRKDHVRWDLGAVAVGLLIGFGGLFVGFGVRRRRLMQQHKATSEQHCSSQGGV